MGIKAKLGRLLPDSLYLKIQYKNIMGRRLNLKNPKTFNEKLQWLKIYDHNPRYIQYVDKHEVKNIVSQKIGAQYVIPTLGMWDKVEDIDFSILPRQFVLKCTHDSGGVVVCRDKGKLDVETVKKKLKKSLNNNYYWGVREWPYKKVRPRIIAEEYKVDKNGGLVDYKLFCFDGKVDNIMVVRGRTNGEPLFYHFNREWELCRFNRLTRSLPEGYAEERPPFIEEMIDIAEKLSEGFIHVRIDLYECDGRLFFGEYTLYNQSGWETGFDDYSDGYLGSLINLPKKNRS